MPTLYGLTSTAMLANLRTDLQDTAAAVWTDTSLNRAIDWAVEAYSWASPWIQRTLLSTITKSPIYASPAGAWFVDRVEYPIDLYPRRYQNFLEGKSPLVPSPVAGMTAAAAGTGGGLGTGAYQYAVTFTTPGGGETLPGPVVNVTVGAGQKVTLSALPVGPSWVTGRNIYRTAVGAAQLKLVTSIADNQTASYVDSLADASLGVNVPVSNTTANIDLFVLQIPPELYPVDATGYVGVDYATKHELDVSGTTIPERHWDTVYTGAQGKALDMYLVTTNDNFEWADGHLRDRVDDSKAPAAWRAQRDVLLQKFESELKRIREEANTGTTRMLHWGDIPLRYERL